MCLRGEFGGVLVSVNKLSHGVMGTVWSNHDSKIFCKVVSLFYQSFSVRLIKFYVKPKAHSKPEVSHEKPFHFEIQAKQSR